MVARLQPNTKIERIKPKEPSEKDRAKEQRQTLFRYNQFISYYLRNGGQATKAAILVGAPEKSAAQQASQWLKIPYIQSRIAAAQERMSAKTEITVEKVMGEVAKLAFSNMGDYISLSPWGDPQIDLSELDPDQWAAISEVITETYMEGHGDDAVPVKRVKIKLHDKLGSLEKLGKYLGAFNGKRSGNAEDDVPEITNHYTLQIGNANIVVQQPASGTSGGSQGSEAQVLTLP